MSANSSFRYSTVNELRVEALWTQRTDAGEIDTAALHKTEPLPASRLHQLDRLPVSLELRNDTFAASGNEKTP